MKRARILLVDDDDGLRAAISSLLRSFDFEIVGEACDGHAAITEAARLTPDVVLLDVAMPRLNGLKALPGLRDCVPSAVIVVLTSQDDPIYHQEAVRLGADAFLLKLQAPHDLIPAIERLLTDRQRRTGRSE